jgi:predicted dehydrogenase
MSEPVQRRDFLKTVAVAGAGLAATAVSTARGADAPPSTSPAPSPTAPPRRGKSVAGLAGPKMDAVRIGVIGVGGRGTGDLAELLLMDGVEIRAICDVVEAKVARAQAYVQKKGHPKPDGYSAGPEDYKKLCDRNDIDLVYIATPWRWHVPMCVDAMTKGKHAAVEVPAAVTIDECWQLVDTAEATQRHCMILENCCYSPEALMMLNLTRLGMLGELLYAEGGYIHDLRSELFSGHGEGLWRIDEHVSRNGNLYPTHGLGPIAQCMGINRGDRFDYLTSMSTPSLGLQAYEPKVPDASKWKHASFACGDMNTTLVKTAKGRVMCVQHDTSNPQPYSRIDYLKGTKGIFRGYPDRIFIEGISKGEDEGSMADFAKYQHPLWTKLEAAAKKAGGHGGMDFVLNWRLIQCLRDGLPLDIDVYDTAAWSVISPLSERSVANRGTPVDVPDFTRGGWETTEPLSVVSA